MRLINDSEIINSIYSKNKILQYHMLYCHEFPSFIGIFNLFQFEDTTKITLKIFFSI